MKSVPLTESTSIEKLQIKSIKDSAAFLSLSERQLWREIHDRKIAYVKLSPRRAGVTQAALEAYIQSRTVAVFNGNDFARQALGR